MEAQFMNADQVPVLEFLCPRFWMEQAKNWTFMEKMVKNGNFLRFAVKLRVLNVK